MEEGGRELQLQYQRGPRAECRHRAKHKKEQHSFIPELHWNPFLPLLSAAESGPAEKAVDMFFLACYAPLLPFYSLPICLSSSQSTPYSSLIIHFLIFF